MLRSARQSKILSIISQYDIETQEELVNELKRNGFAVTQATISRDIKELNLVKTLGKDNRYKYTAISVVDRKLSAKYLNVFRETVVSVTVANNMVVVKTIANSAAAVGSVIEQLKIPEILGVVAYGDTLLAVASDYRSAVAIAEELNKVQC
ncbi:MAG: hypothetical protein NC350_06185 [Corallococcus sp.]|nr:hypothetical protein [Corallococcus sp.]